MASLIRGVRLGKVVREEVAVTVAKLVANGFNPPGLATVLVGARPDSEVRQRSTLPPQFHTACAEALGP